MSIFTKHPNEVGLNYFTHFLFAWSVVLKLLKAVLCCTIHSFLPFVFTTTTSEIINELHNKIEHRKHSEA